jgi:hypothetical protein
MLSLTFLGYSPTPISKYKPSQPPFIPPHIASLSFIDLPELFFLQKCLASRANTLVILLSYSFLF